MQAGGRERSGCDPFIPGKTRRPDQRLRRAFSLVLMLITARSFATQCRPHFPSGQGIIECLQMSFPGVQSKLVSSSPTRTGSCSMVTSVRVTIIEDYC